MSKIVLFLLLLLTAFGWGQEVEFCARKEAPLYLSQSPDLTTSDKDVLCGLLEKAESSKAVVLSPEAKVKVLKRSRFLQRQTVYDRENSTSKTVERLYKVALVQVLSGESKGKTGWTVVSYRETGGDPVIYFAESLAPSVAEPDSEQK